jgi:hypothetical protein
MRADVRGGPPTHPVAVWPERPHGDVGSGTYSWCAVFVHLARQGESRRHDDGGSNGH